MFMLFISCTHVALQVLEFILLCLPSGLCCFFLKEHPSVNRAVSAAGFYTPFTQFKLNVVSFGRSTLRLTATVTHILFASHPVSSQDFVISIFIHLCIPHFVHPLYLFILVNIWLTHAQSLLEVKSAAESSLFLFKGQSVTSLVLLYHPRRL